MDLNKEDFEKFLAETLNLQHAKEEPFDQILDDADKMQEDLMCFAINEAPSYYKWEKGIQVCFHVITCFSFFEKSIYKEKSLKAFRG